MATTILVSRRGPGEESQLNSSVGCMTLPFVWSDKAEMKIGRDLAVGVSVAGRMTRRIGLNGRFFAVWKMD